MRGQYNASWGQPGKMNTFSSVMQEARQNLAV